MTLGTLQGDVNSRTERLCTQEQDALGELWGSQEQRGQASSRRSGAGGEQHSARLLRRARCY